MAELTMVEAINAALAHEMARDNSVVVLGEDVGRNGGVFRATVGLQERFGSERVIDTPLAEALIGSMAIGMAALGLRPVAEIQFSGFIYCCLDQVINHAGRLRHRTRGRLHCPMVIRSPSGGGIHAPEHHSESPEAYFAHTPGIRVVCPSSPLRAYGLLLASIRNPDPVIFLEPTRLYRLVKQDVADNGEAQELDVCYTVREGGSVTIVAWGAMVHEALAAAGTLAVEGIEAEVIDVATIKPLDTATILKAVVKTGRCVIVQEAPRTCGVGAEIAAVLAEEGLLSLFAPVKRVTGYDCVMPLARLEKRYIPDAARIVAAVKSVLSFG